ncbi:unnamed protein product [Prunus armeniaca]|uniref:V-SNARE coiled-coil homology domain-containing protein n=1 Tax=Prunus armeniaca TaxID=36596 RepID=A0A6J5WZ45_PRUAR|nr:unnamed protein product [Prunus armeniaca]
MTHYSERRAILRSYDYAVSRHCMSHPLFSSTAPLRAYPRSRRAAVRTTPARWRKMVPTYRHPLGRINSRRDKPGSQKPVTRLTAVFVSDGTDLLRIHCSVTIGRTAIHICSQCSRTAISAAPFPPYRLQRHQVPIAVARRAEASPPGPLSIRRSIPARDNTHPGFDRRRKDGKAGPHRAAAGKFARGATDGTVVRNAVVTEATQVRGSGSGGRRGTLTGGVAGCAIERRHFGGASEGRGWGAQGGGKVEEIKASAPKNGGQRSTQKGRHHQPCAGASPRGREGGGRGEADLGRRRTGEESGGGGGGRGNERRSGGPREWVGRRQSQGGPQGEGGLGEGSSGLGEGERSKGPGLMAGGHSAKQGGGEGWGALAAKVVGTGEEGKGGVTSVQKVEASESIGDGPRCCVGAGPAYGGADESSEDKYLLLFGSGQRCCFKIWWWKGCYSPSNSLNKELGSKLKEHMQYCVDHPEEISKLAKVKAQVSEVKGVMMENIEKVLDRGEKIELLVDKTENLHQQAQDFRNVGTKMRRKMWLQNMKVKLIVLGILIALILVIILSVCHGFNCGK